MTLIKRLRPFLLRWERMLSLAALALPFVVAMCAGFLWMAEHGWLVHFIVASITLGGGARLVRLAVWWWRKRRDEPEIPVDRPDRIHARIDPGWSERERLAFQSAAEFIATETAKPRPWDDLYELGLEVVERVAQASGGAGKGVLDFTVPEALLLVDHVANRFRRDIREHLPFADSISVGTLHWFWRHRDLAQRLGTQGVYAWRVFRAIKSLPVAVLREIEGAIAGHHASFVTNEGISVVQALLLEEVAVAAVELYSGRLRFSEAELLALRMGASDEDRDRLASEDLPLRVAIAGQVSSGKSSLINALVGEDRAETDIVPTTETAQSYEGVFGDLSVVLMDMPGLDGSESAADRAQAELLSADMVLWTVRANRPAREIDRAAIEAFRRHFAAHPERRMPPFVLVVTFIDELLPQWPYPENFLGEAAMEKVHEVVGAVMRDIGGRDVYPVPVVLTDPDWNVDAVRSRLMGQSGEALMAQRNRLRVLTRSGGLRREASRARRGIEKGLSIFGSRSGQKDDG
ncbi:GTPase family protein [Litorisediminicola beolgyonensis]|uniref:GTPase family protein n=1 Tax=Litorisediminicola beolgyonensis TaxID=1173614 RepID=A0ABW3ZMS4_9RHOB